jgi:ketosteroid isomerase-like protein
MKNKSLATIIGVLSLIIFANYVFAQPTDSRKTSAVAADVEKAIRDYYDAFSRKDIAAVLSYIADDGFEYDSGGYSTAKMQKAALSLGFRSAKPGFVDTFEISDLKIIENGPDGAEANYRVFEKLVEDGKEESLLGRVTDVMVRRGGRWQILAEHNSTIAKPVEPVARGLPMDWLRTPTATADRYSINVDTTVKHGGKASATIKFMCGDDQDAWGALRQPIAADDYRDKRVRLSGWLKTAEANRASLWMRVDGERRMLAFDNMRGREVRGTTKEWTMYSVVLDVPAEAKTISFGAMLIGKGQVWADDLKLEVVDTKVAVTNLLNAEDTAIEYDSMSKAKPPTLKRPVNLGFEDGVIK